MALSSILAILTFTSVLFHATGRIHTFLEAGERSVAEVDRSLALELAGNVSQDHIKALEDMLRTTYQALPKTSDGHLGSQTVRYVLHRHFMHQHGWYMKGLEPGNGSDASLQNWAPVYLQNRLEKRLGGKGINLHELAALTATLEDMVNKEAEERLREVYATLELPIESPLTKEQVDDVLTTFFQIFVRGIYREGKNMTIFNPADAALKRKNFHRMYQEWDHAKAWLDQTVQKSMGSIVGNVPFESTKNAALKVIRDFGNFNDLECQDLKQTLISMEITKNGRMPLAIFYKGKRHSHWSFKEKREYLRILGALDESNASMPMVIMTNYYMIRSNCVEATNLFAVCCRNECEDLLGHLEQKLQAPVATPEQIVYLATTLSSPTVAAPRKISDTLVLRLQEIAARHGVVQLHGRLFTQWLHHAFPLECPFPHEAGTTTPMTPDEWMQMSGHSTFTYTSAELSHVMDDVCYSSGCTNEPEMGQVEIPWSDVEELLTIHHPAAQSSLSVILQVITPFLLFAMGAVLVTMVGTWCVSHTPNKPQSKRITTLALLIAGCSFSLAAMVLGLIDRVAIICASFGCLLMFMLRHKRIHTRAKKDLEKFSV